MKKAARSAPQQESSPPVRGAEPPSAVQPAGNSFAADLVGGGLEASPDGFLDEMELAFGTSFDHVRIHADADDGADPDAVATTRGDDVFLSTGFGHLPRALQEEVLAHELAHVVQQQGGDGQTSTSAVEADADAAAQAALSGGTAAPARTASSTEGHNFGWDDVSDAWDATTDAVGGFVGDVVDSIAEWGIEQIGNVEDLLAYIAEVGEQAARPLIDLVIEYKVEIAVGLVTLNPTAAVATYIVRRLPRDKIIEALEAIDVGQAATIVAAVIAAGAVAVIAPAVFALGPAALPILQQLAAPSLLLLWQHAPAEMKEAVKQLLVEVWPTGLGLALDGGIGATFGYPVYLGAEAYFEVSHRAPGTFSLKRGGILTEALDTGVGAGGFVGIGGDGRSGRGGGGGGGEGGGLGIGGEVGAQAQAGLKQVVHQEFEFPVLDDNAFLSFAITAVGADTGVPMQVLSLFSSEMRAINPLSYNTKTKFEFKVFAEGNAHAGAGVRTGGEDTPRTSTWDNQSGMGNTGNRQGRWWTRWVQASVFGRIAGEAGVGFEVQNLEWAQDEEGVRVPSKMKVEAYGEGSAALQIAHAIPVVSSALPPGIDFEGGAGIRVGWELTGSPTDDAPQISDPTYSLTVKTGNLDRYQGAASETTIALGSLTSETFESLDTFLANIRAGSQFKRRFSVGTTIGRKYFNAARRQGAFNVMLPAEYRNYGFRIEGYLDLESQLTADQVRSIFRTITSASSEYAEGGEVLQRLYVDVMTFLSTGQGPPEVTGALERIANTVLSSLTRLNVHGLVGLSVAAGGQLSAGAKVRLQGRFGGQLTMDADVLQQINGQITVDEIRQLISGAVDAASGVLEVEGEQAE